MKHLHNYDTSGKQLCCSQEDKINAHADAAAHSDDDGHDHSNSNASALQMFLPAIISLILLSVGLALDHYFKPEWFSAWLRFFIYVAAYLPVGFPVIKEAIINIFRKEFFSEFLLMSIATLGAFIIGVYPEGVAVMLFYAVGEVFQTLSISRAKSDIKALLDQRPDTVTLLIKNVSKTVKAETVQIGAIIQLKAGDKLALDGELQSGSAVFNTAALTGESKPDSKSAGDIVLAGMINLNTVSTIKVTALYQDSKLSKILQMVQDATAQKAPSELFIRKFAKIYTPFVVALAFAITLLPYFFVADYQFSDWLYRALVFLVISCPCALVISIPLGYFGGIGAASRNGILVKGSNFLDILATIQHVVMDKTGTMTEGVFEVQEVVIQSGVDEAALLKKVNVLENQSTHPVATAIGQYVGTVDSNINCEEVTEIAGHGLTGLIDGQKLLVGNFKLMDKFNIAYDINPSSIAYTLIAIAYNGTFMGYITIADSIKEDSLETINRLHAQGIKVTMLSGDKSNVVKYVAQQLGIRNAYGDLLPEDKVTKVEEIKANKESVAFVGDGVNDAPVVALSDVGMAMGGLGSDATIESADIVIQDDKPSKIPVAIEIGKQTKKVVWQNIALAFTVKAIVLILGAGGLATMWEAVFADVGVSLLAIMNAVRIQKMTFNSNNSTET